MSLEPENSPIVDSAAHSGAGTHAAHPPKLSGDEARQLVEQLAVVTKSGLPIAPALRAAAAELPHHRLAAAMSRLATDLEMGRSLEEILHNNPRFLPPYIQRLIETGVKSGNLPEVLVQLVEIDRSATDLRRSVRMAVAYPIVLFAFWLVLLALFASYVVPDLLRTIKELKVTMYWPTLSLEWIAGKWMLRVLGFLAAAIPMIIVSARIIRRPLGWQRLLTDIPLVGPTLLWRGVANWSRLLSLLLHQRLPLPEALRLASTGIAAPVMTVAGLRAARSVEGGRNLADSLALVRGVPPTLIPIVRFGEGRAALPEALSTAADLFERRVQIRATLLQSVLPPVVFVFTAVITLWLVNAVVLPLFTMLSRFVFFSSWKRPTPLWTEDIGEQVVKYALIAGGVWVVISIALLLYYSAIGTLFSELINSGGRRSFGFGHKFGAVFWWVYGKLTRAISLVFMVGVAGVFAIPLWIATLIIIALAKKRYREAELQYLFELLKLAAAKRIPLAAAVRGFAEEKDDRLGDRAFTLAQLIDNGVPLDAAMRSARIRLPDDAQLAVASGLGGWGSPATARFLSDTGSNAIKNTVTSRLFYLALVTLFTVGIVIFLAESIIPKFQRIFGDFKTRMPTVTTAVIRSVMSYEGIAFWVIGVILVLLLATTARYIGLINWNPLVLQWFRAPLDQALVLRSLAQSIDRETDIASAVSWVAKRHPQAFVRDRLRVVKDRIENGVHWCESLRLSRLLPAADAGLLRAAERVGNLSWAMNDCADRLTRRFTNRLTAVVSIVLPIVLLLLAAVVFFVAVGMIFPLAKLISDLSMPR